MRIPSLTRRAEARTARRRTATGVAMDGVAWLGSLVSLTALLVLAAAAGGLVDGVPAEDGRSVTVTHER